MRQRQVVSLHDETTGRQTLRVENRPRATAQVCVLSWLPHMGHHDARPGAGVSGARRTDRLEQLVQEIREAGGEAQCHALDVTSLTDMQAFTRFALDTYGRLDVVINNAGAMPLSKLEELKVEEWNRMIDVNIRGVLHGMAAALPVMQQQGHGHFVNVSSTAGHFVYPTAAVYSATTCAVIAISETLRQEHGTICVTIIFPGATESELADSISDAGTRDAMKEFRRVAMLPEAIARAIGFAIEQPDGVDVSAIIVRPTASAYEVAVVGPAQGKSERLIRLHPTFLQPGGMDLQARITE